MAHILHINDNHLLVQSALEEGGSVLQRSQGYAWLKGKEVLFDLNSELSPRSQCRLSPQQINSRYWQQCAKTAIAGNGAGMRHAADLIWKHLTELKAKLALDELAMVVPAHYQDSHLKLLLGVAKASGLQATALISKPVLAAQQANLSVGRAWHIDVQMHQVVVSQLSVNETEVVLEDIDVKPEIGLYALQEALLHKLQASFIQTDRFDPLHDAETEQQLFDQLPSIVERACGGEKVSVSLGLNNKLYNAEASNADMQSVFSELTELIDSLSSNQIIVDLNDEFDLSQLTGIADKSISWADTPKPIVNAMAVNMNDAGEVIYQTSLPVSKLSRVEKSPKTPLVAEQSQPQASTESSSASELIDATHLMQLGLAVPIQNAKIAITNARLSLAFSEQASDVVGMLKSGELQIINDQTRHALKANDRLMSPLADGVITAVTLMTEPCEIRH